MKEDFLKKEWNNLDDVQKNYGNYNNFKDFMEQTAKEYLALKEEVNNYKGTIDDFVKELDYVIRYEKNEYADFNYGNLTCTIKQINNQIILSNYVEIWNDGICSCEYNSFDIEECLN